MGLQNSEVSALSQSGGLLSGLEQEEICDTQTRSGQLCKIQMKWEISPIEISSGQDWEWKEKKKKKGTKKGMA